MRFVERNVVTEPPSLKEPKVAVKAERDEASLFYKSYDPELVPRPKSFEFKEYKSHDVQSTLRLLFHGKCAYCETDLGDGLEVEHFRPKGLVIEDPKHSGYWWLAHAWCNLLPACAPCNKTRRQHVVTEDMTVEQFIAAQAVRARSSYGKANQFPILGVRATSSAHRLEDEQAQLINPTLEDPEPYFKWSNTGCYSVVVAKPSDVAQCSRALTNINVFALNRVNLVQSRTRILTELRFQRGEIFKELEGDMAEGGGHGHIMRALKRVESMRRLHGPEQPFSAMVKAFVDEFVEELLDRVR